MSAHRVARIRTFLARGGYRGADMDVVRQVTAATAFLTALVIAVLAPLSPPDGPVPAPIGWSILCIIVGGLVLVALRLDRTVAFNPNAALAIHYAGLMCVATVVWLSDGTDSPYTTLFLLWMGVAGASHPPRRTLGIIGAGAVLTLLPFLYDDWSGVFAGDMALRLVVWSALTMMACVWTTSVRVQRADLLADEEQAKRQARLDPLTGLGNRRAFDERLRAAAKAMRAAVRDHDACYRWGGDEFAVLLPGVEQDVAEKVAERVSASIVASCIRPGGDPQTLAWGTAELAPHMQASDLLASADLALMTRKHKRNHGRFRAELPESESN